MFGRQCQIQLKYFREIFEETLLECYKTWIFEVKQDNVVERLEDLWDKSSQMKKKEKMDSRDSN